jgi:DNA-binding protein HU-beta
MTKAELVAEIAKKSELSKADTERAINAFVDVAKKTLKKEGRLALAGFGTFVVSKRKARKGRKAVVFPRSLNRAAEHPLLTFGGK